MKIIIAGGGTAGFISATILKKFLDCDVTVIHSSKIGIVGVGEGSTEHFAEYMKFLNISQYSIIKECDATYKAGIYFDGWTPNNYMHSVGENFCSKYAQYSYMFGYQIANNLRTFIPQSILDSKIDKFYFNNESNPPYNQFHFNTHKLNNFLHKVAESMGISVIDDEIVDVYINEGGQIESVRGEKGLYLADFFIDATGFKRLLIGKLGTKWISFKEYLKMNSAIVFPTPAEDREYTLYTTAKAMDYGWAFSLPVWGRYGNGYVFDNEYISVDEAKEEVVKTFGDVTFGKEFSFDAGYLENSWINNCAAVGLSSAFVEPLEATSIGTTIQQSFLLMHRIANYSDADIKQYNNVFKSIMENIRDFIFLHYMVKKNNTDFWKNIQKITPPNTLQEKLLIWKNRLPIPEDFYCDSNYTLFKSANFIIVMEGLGLFDREQIKKEFLNYPKDIRNIAEENTNAMLFNESFNQKFSHKEIIELTRNLL